MKKILAMCLAVVMLFSLAACTPTITKPTDGTDPSHGKTEIPDYLNMDSALPLVKPESGEKIKLTLWAIRGADNDKDTVEKTWQWKYLADKLGIELDITLIDHLSAPEKKNLALATNQIPDMMLGFGLTAADLLTYGSEEKILMDLSGLIDTCAPDIKVTLDNYPEVRQGWTTPDGAIYSLANVSESSVGGYAFFVNKTWMQEAGITKLPKTIDEFVDMLREFKKLHGDDENYSPLGGHWGPDNALWGLLQAYGVYTSSFRHDQIANITIVGDSIGVVPGNDVYGEFLKLCKTLYDEGLISKDYFTRDYVAARTEAGEERCGVYAQFGMATMNSFCKNPDGTAATPERQMEFQENWSCLSPLTSQYCQTPVYPINTGINVGNFVISSKCKYPEVAIRFANYFFSEEGSVMFNYGPMKGVDDTFGLVGSAGGNPNGWYMEKVDGSVVVHSLHNFDYLSGHHTIGVNGANLKVSDTGKTLYQLYFAKGGFPDDVPAPNTFDTNTPGGRVNKDRDDAIRPYSKNGLPGVVFIDADTAARVADLQSVIKDFATAETAKFITGARPIDQIADFQRQINSVGGTEISEIYTELFGYLLDK